jgi:hypothetical protein
MGASKTVGASAIRQVQDEFLTWRSVFGAIVNIATLSAKSTGPDVFTSVRKRY